MSHAVAVGSKHLESFKFVSLSWKHVFCKAVIHTKCCFTNLTDWVTFPATTTTTTTTTTTAAAAELAVSLEAVTRDKRPVC
jgi:hypothetical protein